MLYTSDICEIVIDNHDDDREREAERYAEDALIILSNLPDGQDMYRLVTFFCIMLTIYTEK